MAKKFPLGFWNYAPLGMYGTEAVRDWADAGMNLCLSPRFDSSRDDPSALTAFLDACEPRGIRLVLDDPRANWVGAASDPGAYRARFLEAVKDFGAHPATYGFYVGDEPRADQMADAKAAVRIQRELAPHLVPFVNFNPYWDGNENTLGGKSFDEWIDEFVKETGLQQLSYDRYSQMNPPDAVESGIQDYYQSLRRFTAAAKRNGVPLWVSNLSVGHFRYRCPKEDDFRWQLNTSVLSGANCVWWFFLYMRVCRINYRVAPIDEHGERTETFEWLSRVQRSFQHQYGALFAELIHEETWHTLRAYGGYPLLEYDRHPLLKRVTCDHNLPGLAAFFRAPDGTRYLAVANNSQTESGYFHYYLRPCVTGMYRVTFSAYDSHAGGASGIPVGGQSTQATAWGGTEVDCAKNDVCNGYRKDESGIHNGAWLAPGQMEVFRLVIEEK